MVRLAIHVTPRSGVESARGWRGAELLVRVSAAPEAGKANAAACRVVAKSLGVSKTSVVVVRGDTARHKILEISGIDDAAVEAAFGRPDEALF